MFKANAAELTAQDCKSVGVDLTSVGFPIEAKSYFNRQVRVFKVDTIETAAASSGLAIIKPKPNDQILIENCFVVTGFTDVKFSKVKSVFSAKAGLEVTMPVDQYNPESGKGEPAGDLKLTIKLTSQNSSLKVEQVNK